MSKDINDTPDKWAGDVTMLTPLVGYSLSPNDGQNIVLWHWCTAVAYGPRWIGRGCGDHRLVSTDPLHLEPSLACGEQDCPMHGFIHNGQWIPA